MREHYEALGRVAGCAHSLDASYHGWVEGDGVYAIEIEHGDIVTTVVAEPYRECFVAQSDRQLTRIDGFTPPDSIPMVQADIEGAVEGIDRGPVSNHVVKSQGQDGVDYFDGFRSRVPLFVYDDFTPKDLHERMRAVDKVNTEMFDRAVDAFDIEIEKSEDEVTGSDEDIQNDEPSAFQ